MARIQNLNNSSAFAWTLGSGSAADLSLFGRNLPPNGGLRLFGRPFLYSWVSWELAPLVAVLWAVMLWGVPYATGDDQRWGEHVSGVSPAELPDMTPKGDDQRWGVSPNAIPDLGVSPISSPISGFSWQIIPHDDSLPTVPEGGGEDFFNSEARKTLESFRLSSPSMMAFPIEGLPSEGLPYVPVGYTFVPVGYPVGYQAHWSEGQDEPSYEPAWGWEILPPGLMYRSYLAGEKEPRMAWSSLYDFKRERTVWETALGGRAGLLRYGSADILNPQGFQLDAEGAVFTRLLPSEPSTMMEAADFRFGFLATYRRNQTAVKVGYYHISSHLGDEFLIANPTFPRINYVRDAAIVGVMRDITPSIQAYGEVANAIGREGGAEPWEFQWGCQYCPTPVRGNRGAPYAGVNFYSRQDFNFEPSLNVIVGWNWAGSRTGERFRVGMQYYNGPALQYSFFDRRERLLGGGLWFDY